MLARPKYLQELDAKAKEHGSSNEAADKYPR